FIERCCHSRGRWAFNSSIVLQAAVPVAAARGAVSQSARRASGSGGYVKYQQIVKRVEYNCNINNLFIETSSSMVVSRLTEAYLRRVMLGGSIERRWLETAEGNLGKR